MRGICLSLYVCLWVPKCIARITKPRLIVPGTKSIKPRRRGTGRVVAKFMTNLTCAERKLSVRRVLFFFFVSQPSTSLEWPTTLRSILIVLRRPSRVGVRTATFSVFVVGPNYACQRDYLSNLSATLFDTALKTDNVVGTSQWRCSSTSVEHSVGQYVYNCFYVKHHRPITSLHHVIYFDFNFESNLDYYVSNFPYFNAFKFEPWILLFIKLEFLVRNWSK